MTQPAPPGQLAEVQSILDRRGITMAAMEAQVEDVNGDISDHLNEGILVPLSSVRRAHRPARGAGEANRKQLG